jgi:hypothetical protein
MSDARIYRSHLASRRIWTIKSDLTVGAHRNSAPTKPQKPPHPIKSVQEGLDHSWDALVIRRTFGTSLRTCKRETIP